MLALFHPYGGTTKMLSLFIRHLHFCNKKCPTEKQSVSKTTVFNKAFIYFKFKDLKVCSFQTLWLYFTIGVSECRILIWANFAQKHHIMVEFLKFRVKRKGWDPGSQPDRLLIYVLIDPFIKKLHLLFCMKPMLTILHYSKCGIKLIGKI